MEEKLIKKTRENIIFAKEKIKQLEQKILNYKIFLKANEKELYKLTGEKIK